MQPPLEPIRQHPCAPSNNLFRQFGSINLPFFHPIPGAKRECELYREIQNIPLCRLGEVEQVILLRTHPSNRARGDSADRKPVPISPELRRDRTQRQRAQEYSSNAFGGSW